MWVDGWIPEKRDKKCLFWSVLTIESTVTNDDGTKWHGRRRHWVPANADGLAEIARLQDNPDLRDIYFSQGLYFCPDPKQVSKYCLGSGLT
jgi:wobble nucleotide-excising tRNase